MNQDKDQNKEVSQVLVPQWSGQPITVADIPKVGHLFKTKYGEISIECTWEQARYDDSAYIWLFWKADIFEEREIIIRFINPETQMKIYEVSLGKILMGEEVFTSNDLGFDPSNDRWAIAVII
ncbi:MAG: hypothetical protein GY756_18310 [bacterium]|nr:hypothetical protein [bacterium]